MFVAAPKLWQEVLLSLQPSSKPGLNQEPGFIPNSTLSFSKARPILPALDKADLSQGRVFYPREEFFQHAGTKIWQRLWAALAIKTLWGLSFVGKIFLWFLV